MTTPSTSGLPRFVPTEVPRPHPWAGFVFPSLDEIAEMRPGGEGPIWECDLTPLFQFFGDRRRGLHAATSDLGEDNSVLPASQ